jgi:hypothetical protein
VHRATKALTGSTVAHSMAEEHFVSQSFTPQRARCCDSAIAGMAWGLLSQQAQQPAKVVTSQSASVEQDARAPEGVVAGRSALPHAERRRTAMEAMTTIERMCISA